jgi:hypothetical protein
MKIHSFTRARPWGASLVKNNCFHPRFPIDRTRYTALK